MELNNNYDIRNVECALSSAVSTAMPVLAGEHEVLQRNASGLVRTLQFAQSQNMVGDDDVAEVATYALRGIDKAKSELGTFRGAVPDTLFDDYSTQLNFIREKFIPYAYRR